MENSPTENYIPEFAFFMEGHSIAQTEVDAKPQGLQQMWLIPIQIDGDRVRGKELFAEFLTAVRRMSQHYRWLGNAVRVQVCDVKCLPPGRALLSSSLGTTSLAVAVSVENVRGYRSLLGGWGSPERAFRKLTRKFVGKGVKVHLTKNVCAKTAHLRTMYRSACRDFLEVKRTLDPNGIWGSDFLELIASVAK